MLAALISTFPASQSKPMADVAARNRLRSKRSRCDDYMRPLPEFIDRFGAAYKAELAAFVECCRTGRSFPTSHRDGLRAQDVISAGMQRLFGAADAAQVKKP